MRRAVLASVILAGAAAVAAAQSASAPLVITATVVSTCRVDVPTSADVSAFAVIPIALTCAHRGTAPRVGRPMAPLPHGDIRDALLTIDF